MKRYFRVKATGQWLAAVLEDARFDGDPQAMADSMVRYYRGLDIGELEAVDVDADSSDDDPRTGTLLYEEGHVEPVPFEPPVSPIDELLDALADANNFADAKSKAAAVREKRRNPPAPVVPVGPERAPGDRNDPNARIRPVNS